MFQTGFAIQCNTMPLSVIEINNFIIDSTF